MPAEMIDNYVPHANSRYGGGGLGMFGGSDYHEKDFGYDRPYFDHMDRPAVTVEITRLNPKRYTVNRGVRQTVRESVPIYDLVNKYRMLPKPVWNATTLRIDEWRQMDTTVIKAYRSELRAWDDLASAAPYGGFNGYAKSVLEWETMSDPGTAVVDMDWLSQGRSDTPRFQLEGLPLVLTHSDFWVSDRRLEISKNGGSPLDSTMPEAAGRRVGEKVEDMLIGVATGPTYGEGRLGGYGQTSAVYGYINHPLRMTKIDVTTPTGANPNDTITDILEMRQQQIDANVKGPWVIYHSTDWDQYLDHDYSFINGTGWATAPNSTLRDRIKRIDGISDVRRLDRLTPALSHAFTLLMVDMSGMTAKAVNGMGLKTIQYTEMGGAKHMFRVGCINVGRLTADFNGVMGLLHARTA